MLKPSARIAEKPWRPSIRRYSKKNWLDYILGKIYSVEKISSQLKHDTQSYLLLIEHEKPVAFAAYSPREEDPEIYKLHKLYCLPETQGKGYGKVLIREVINKTIESQRNVPSTST